MTIPDVAPSIGTTWIEDSTEINDAAYTELDGHVRRKRHTRRERLRQTVLALEAPRVTSVRLDVERGEEINQEIDPDGAPVTVPYPTQGKQYIVTRDARDVADIRRADGSRPSDDERRSVANLAFGSWGRSRLGPMPRRPIAIGESFPVSDDDLRGTVVLSTLRGTYEARVAVVTASLTGDLDDRHSEGTDQYTVDLRTGWTVHLSSATRFTQTVHLPPAVSRSDNRVTREVTVTYASP